MRTFSTHHRIIGAEYAESELDFLTRMGEAGWHLVYYFSKERE